MTTQQRNVKIEKLYNPLNLVFIGIFMAALIGLVVTTYPSFIIAGGIFGIILWLFLLRVPEFSLAMHFVGFQLYPIVLDSILGIKANATLTTLIYLFLTSSYLIGSILIQPLGKIKKILTNRIFVMVIFFLLWMIINWLTLSFNSEFAGRRMVFSVFLMFSPLLGAALLPYDRWNRFFCWIIGIGLITLSVAIPNFVASNIDFSSYRFTIVEQLNPLTLGYNLGVIIIVSLSFVIKNKKAKLILIILTALSVFIILFTGSRGPIVSLMFGGIAILTSFRSGRFRTILIIVLVGAGLALLLSLPAVASNNMFELRYGAYLDQLSSGQIISNENLLNQLTSHRYGLWVMAFQIWQTSPIWGIGVANHGQSFDWYPHNMFFETLMDLGLVGLVILLALLMIVFREMVKIFKYSKNKNHIEEYVIIGLIAFSFTSTNFSYQLQSQLHWWLTLGLLIGYSLRYSNLLTNNSNSSV